MADYDVTYQQNTYANAVADFDYFNDNGASTNSVINEPAANANAPDWQWTTGASPSTGTGPPAANGGCTYPESSSPMAVGDISRATMITANQVDADTYGMFVTVDMCLFGNTAGEIKVQAWDGATWNDLGTYAGNSNTAFVGYGPYDCTSYTNSDFYVRIQITMGAGGSIWQHDFAFQNLRIYGDSKVTYKIDGITKNNSGTALGSCETFLIKDNQDQTASFLAHQVSNVSTGAYSFTGLTDDSTSYIVISWKDDDPHVFDTTDHILKPVPE